MRSSRDKRDLALLASMALIVVGILVGLGIMLFGGDDLDAKPRPDAHNQPKQPTRSNPKPQDPPTDPAPPVSPSPDTGGPISPPIEPVAPPSYPLGVEGNTPFQRRLSLGAGLHRAMADLKAGSTTPALVAQAILAHERDFLVLDSITVDKAAGKAWGTGSLVAEMRGGLELIASGNASNALEALTSMLAPLMEPRRDLEAFTLTTLESSDGELGMDSPVRVWTIQQSFPRESLRIAQTTILRLKGILKLDPLPGFDVLATPGLGSETFGVLAASSRASGLYLIPDRFCVLRSTLGADWLPEVMEHEMVHAITFPLGKSATEPFESSRFVSEGLAEYLRKHEEGDTALDIPASRFRDECALLYQYIVAKQLDGWDFNRLDIAAFLALSPEDFYQYGPFAYLVAQSSMAALPKGMVLKALTQEKSDVSLVGGVRALGWSGLMEFVEKTMVGGDHRRARVMDGGAFDRDALGREFDRLTGRGGGTGLGRPRLGVSVEDMLRTIGVTVSGDGGVSKDSSSSPHTFFDATADSERSQADALLDVMLALKAANRVEIHSEVDRSLLETFTPFPINKQWLGGLDPSELEGRQQSEFLESFVDQFRIFRDDRSGVNTPWFELSNSIHSTAVTKPFTTRMVPVGLGSFVDRISSMEDKTVNVVMIVGGTDQAIRERANTGILKHLTAAQQEQWHRMTVAQRKPVIESALPLLFADALVASGVVPATVLVIDLSIGSGSSGGGAGGVGGGVAGALPPASDARAIHEAFGMVMPTGSRLAYWNPQKALQLPRTSR